MISAWKKLLNMSSVDGADGGAANHNNYNGATMPPGVHKLDKDLQRKFARGVNYNMKVVIKGDNRVGKTSLFLRLKGYGFQEDYIPTESLNVTSIDWSYKATDDVVKIDLWEAVDAAASKKSVNFVDLKMENDTNAIEGANGQTPGSHQIPNGAWQQNQTPPSATRVTITSTKLQPNRLLNNNNNNNNLTSPIPCSYRQALAELSESLDVYKGANAVLLVLDMTKLWTFKYVQSELPKIPNHIPVLVVANHRDQGHHRTVSPEQIKAFIESIPRDPCDGIVMYTEASMRNGFGLRLIEKFFNIPFLKLQEASLLKQIELNRQEYLTTREELHLMEESTNKEYEQYLELQTIKRRQLADAMSPVNSGLKQLDETTREQIRNTSVSSDIIDKRASNVRSIESDNTVKSPVVQNHNQSFVNDRLPSIVIGAKCPLPESKTITFASVANDKTATATATTATAAAATTTTTTTAANGATSVSVDGSANANSGEKSDDSDEEEEEEEVRANPLVADYQSDIDSDDQLNK